MREIKFRAWDGKKIWEVRELEWLVGQLNAYVGVHWLPKEDYTLMQYTGLTDKNGVEIYEGDIVTAPNIARPLTVFYEPRRAGYRMGWRGADTQYDKQEPIFDEDYCEVIGNIYENPELLK